MKSVLVIEDNDNNMVLMTFILQRHGFRVTGARDGRSGLALAQTAHYDFVLLDIQLPDIDGLEVLQELRAQGVNKPVIAVTSHAMAGDRARLLAAGCDGYIEKPIDPEHIVEHINAVLERWE